MIENCRTIRMLKHLHATVHIVVEFSWRPFASLIRLANSNLPNTIVTISSEMRSRLPERKQVQYCISYWPCVLKAQCMFSLWHCGYCGQSHATKLSLALGKTWLNFKTKSTTSPLNVPNAKPTGFIECRLSTKPGLGLLSGRTWYLI